MEDCVIAQAAVWSGGTIGLRAVSGLLLCGIELQPTASKTTRPTKNSGRPRRPRPSKRLDIFAPFLRSVTTTLEQPDGRYPRTESGGVQTDCCHGVMRIANACRTCLPLTALRCLDVVLR